MPGATPFPNLTREHIRELQRKATTKRDFQRVQCLAFRQLGSPSHDTGVFVGLSAVTVRRVWNDWRERGEEALFGDRRGGRYNEHISEDEEKAFLAPFFTKAGEGGILIVQQVQEAYEKRIGRKVPTSTVYAMLHRHGWRKIVPRPSHPKGDPIAQTIFRTSFPPGRPTSRHRS